VSTSIVEENRVETLEPSLPQWQRIGLVVIVLLLSILTVVMTFQHVIRTDPSQLAGKYDIYRYYGPSNYFLDCRLHNGELPLWNPMTFCGIPHAANPQSFVFYPPNLIRSLLNFRPSPYSTQAGWVIMIGLHLIFAFICAFLFSREHKLSVPASLVVAASFTFSSLMVRRACEYHLITTGAWTPFLLLMLKKLLDAPTFRNKLALGLAGGIFLGVSILGGFLQFANYMGILLGMYAVLYRVSYPRGVESQAAAGTARLWGSDVIALAVFFILGGLVAAVMISPAAESAAFTSRMKGMPVPMYSDLWKWTRERFYQSFLVYTGMRYEAETVRNSGVGVLLLAAGALFYSRKRMTLLFLLLYLILVDCCFGPPLPFATLVSWLTPFSMSAYTRGYDFAIFPLSMLAGLGVDAMIAPSNKAWRSMVRTVILAIAALLTLPMLAQWLKIYKMLPVSPWVVYLPALVFVAMFLMTWSPFPKHVAVTLALLFPLLVFSETYAWNKHFVPYLTAKRVRDTRPITGNRFIPQDNTKEADPIANRYLYSMRTCMNGVDPMFLQNVRDYLSGGPPAREYHRLVKDWEPTAENQRGNLFLKRWFWLAKSWARGAQPPKSAQYPSTTTVFINDPSGLPLEGIPEIRPMNTPFSDNTVQIPIAGAESRFRPVSAGTKVHFSLKFTLPKNVEGKNPGPAGAVHTVLCYQYSGTCGAKIATEITEPATGRRQWCPHARLASTRGQERTVYVPLPDFPNVTADITVEASKGSGQFEIKNAYLIVDQGDEDGLLRIVKLRANTMDIEAGPLDSPRILLFTDAMYPGWHAYVDGVETTMFTANDVFKAIVAPAGTHQIRFAYRPWSIYLGAAVSILSTLASILGALYLVKHAKTQKGTI